MDQDQSPAGPRLDAGQERSPEQVREEIEETRAELGDTVAALGQKTDVKAQAKHAVQETKQTMTAQVSGIRQTVSGKTDQVVTSAQQATPQSAAEAGRRVQTIAKENSTVLVTAAALGVGVLLGRWSNR